MAWDFFAKQPSPVPSPVPTNIDPNNPNPAPNPAPAIKPPENTSTNTQPNPLDKYAELFNNATKANPTKAPEFTVDGKVVNEVASTLDFMTGLSPEILEKAKTGDAASLFEAIQHAGRQAYVHAVQHNSMLTGKFVDQRSSYDLNQVGSRVRSELTSNALNNGDVPLHPLQRAELKRIAEQLQAAHPDAPAADIAQQARTYLNDLAASFAGPSNEVKKTGDGATDWDEYFKNG
jgi:hypothetical protein